MNLQNASFKDGTTAPFLVVCSKNWKYLNNPTFREMRVEEKIDEMNKRIDATNARIDAVIADLAGIKAELKVIREKE